MMDKSPEGMVCVVFARRCSPGPPDRMIRYVASSSKRAEEARNFRHSRNRGETFVASLANAVAVRLPKTMGHGNVRLTLGEIELSGSLGHGEVGGNRKRNHTERSR